MPTTPDKSFTAVSYKPLLWVEPLLLGLICVFGLGMIAMGAWYCYPNAEELELSSAARDLGMTRSMLDLMITYDGRYSTNFLHAFNPLVINWIDGYKIMPLITVSCFILSLFYFLRTVLIAPNSLRLFSLSVLLTLILIGSVISLPSALYWMGGSFVYLYPCTFFLLFISLLIRYMTLPSANNMFFILTACLLVIGIGFNEMFLPVYSLLLSGLLIWLFMYDRPGFFTFLPLALIGYSSILFFVLSPGVTVRLTDSERGIDIRLFSNNFKNLLLTLFNLIRKPIFFCSLIYTTILFKQNVFSFKFRFSTGKTAISLLGCLGVCYLMCVVYYLPKQEAFGYPERIYPPILFVFVLSLFLAGGLFTSSSTTTESDSFFLSYSKYVLLIFVLINFICGNNNITFLLNDLTSGRMSSFKTFCDKRTAIFLNAQKDSRTYKAVLVDKMDEKNYPKTIYSYPDIETNRNESIWNKCQEEYFRLDEVSVKGDTSKRFR